jgi:hypothetical protein
MQRLIPALSGVILAFFLWISAVSAASHPSGEKPVAKVKGSQGRVQPTAHMACCLEVETESPRPVSRPSGLLGNISSYASYEQRLPKTASVLLNGGYALSKRHPLYLLFLQLKLGKTDRNFI